MNTESSGPQKSTKQTESVSERAAAIAAAADVVRSHYANVIIPMWRSRGYNQAMRLPYESLLANGVADPKRYRAMACARQLYVHTIEKDSKQAQALFQALIEYFTDSENGGFYYSIDPAGRPLEVEKDLYTHAFVIFSCATYYARFGEPEAKRVLDETFKTVVERFTVDTATGLSNSVLSQNFKQIKTPSRQNPLMHLAEAYLAAARATDDPRYDDALAGLLTGIATAFVDSKNGCIMELPAGTSNNRIEPGHQFEWFFLAHDGSHPAFSAARLDDALARAFAFAQKHGIDSQTKGVVAALRPDGSILDSSQRIWAQTEYLRALACHPDQHQRDLLRCQIERFSQRFLHCEGWIESFDATGKIGRPDMPSTTAYHLISAYLALR